MTSFDIRVALLGYVSAGKSTVLNALLQGKHSAVGKRRSTAGVNFFRVHTKEKSTGVGDAAVEDSLKTGVSPVEVNGSRPRDSIISVQSASETLEAIERDNAELRESGATKESTFDVVLDEPLCEMRSDTKLVLIDVPGLNEAGSNDLYRTYVNAKWDTFDCVLTIVDVYQGVNTEEQVRLLELIKDNLRLRKNIPIIVLCNKVDDPEDEEVSDLVDEVRKKVEEIFTDGGLDQSATSGEVSLSSLLTRCVQSSAVVSAPVFIPISAENAFVYRTASRLSFEDFCNLDNTLIEKLGREEVGKQKWRKLSQQEKHQAVYNIVSNASTCAESIEAANFHTFLQALNDCIGGSDKQFKLIEQQLAVARKNLSFEKVIANELPMIANINRLLDKAPLYSTYFWDTYQKCSPRQIQRFLTHMDHRSLHNNMSQLSAYGRFVASTDNDQQELGKVLEKMIALVRVYLRKIVHSIETAREADWSGPLTRQPLYDWGADERGWVDSISGLPVKGQRRKKEPPSNNPHHWERTSPGEWKNKYTDKVVTGSANNPAFGKLSWATLSRRDFCTMSQSILLLAYSKSFCEYFGSEKVMLEEYIHEYNRMINRVLQEYHQLNANDDDDDEVACAIPSPRIDREYAVLYTFLQGAHDETTGEFVPLYPDKYALVARVSMPNRLSDPNHWGHLVWQFSEYADNLNV